jgi:type II secretory pathway pseudopilin PulG
MRLLEKMCFVVLTSGLALGQATASNSGSAGTGSVADELKALREAISEQQKQISQQQQQMSQQQQQIQDLRQQLQNQSSGTPHVADAALRTAPVPMAATVVQETEKPKDSPLSFRIGGTEFTPGGFVDFENVFRTTNTGGSTTTAFGGIPFSNTVAGHLTEFRSTGQYSRYNLKISGKYGANNVLGYIEGDFNGNDAANVFVSSNPHTNRLRLYWLDLKRGKWEFLGGQTWGLQTPNRVGLSPMPADVFVTLGEDAQTHVGLPYTRAAEFRAVYHFSDHFQWGVAIQNPDQFTNGEVIFPATFNAQLGGQFDAADRTTTPNAFPDFHTKFAWDNDVNGKHMHFEAGGLLTSAKITALAPSNTPAATFGHDTKIGAAFHGAFNFELFKGFRVLGNGMWGDGDGRYLIGFGPQAVVVPVNASGFTCAIVGTQAVGCDAKISMVHAGGGILGSELQIKKSQFGFYYGGFYYQRNSFPDITSPVVLGPTALVTCGALGTPLQNKPCVGFGGANSGATNNRAIQEATLDWTQTFWKNPQYGAVLLVTQTSYVTRAPWVVPAGAPKNAHLMMGYVSLKYVLP